MNIHLGKVPFALIPCLDSIRREAWPEDILSSQDGSDGSDLLSNLFTGRVSYVDYGQWKELTLALFILTERVIPFPIINAISLVFGNTTEEEFGVIRASLRWGDLTEYPAMTLDGAETDEPGMPSAEIMVEARIEADILQVRFDREILKPVVIDPGTYEVSEKSGHVEIDLPFAIVIDGEGNIEFEVPATTSSPLAFSDPFMIGDTGVVLEVPEIVLRFSIHDALPDWSGIDHGLGAYIRRVTLHLPAELDFVPSSVDVEELAITDGGISGTLSLGVIAAPSELTNLIEHFGRIPAGTFESEFSSLIDGNRDLRNIQIGGFRAILHYLSITFEQSLPAASSLKGYAFIPFAEKWMAFDLSLGGPNGDLMLELGGVGGQGLVNLDNEYFEIIADSIRYELRDGVNYAVINGSVRPKIGGFDWPKFKVERLAIGSNGDIDLDGGWIDVPETLTLDFHGFKIDVNQIGMGTVAAEGTESERQWLGFSGGITLIEGLPLNASVQGLKISWDPNPPEPIDPLDTIKVSLEGIGVLLEIPNTLRLEGAVRYQELERPLDIRPSDEICTTSSAAGVFGHVFTGSVMVDISALKTQVSGELLIGELTQYSYDTTGALVIGETFTSLYVVLDARQLPFAIPLGATGTGLYGLQGLFGMHVAPDRHQDNGEPENWYLWYKAERGNESAYSVTKVVKWGPLFDNYAFGAGLTIGTVYDDGFTINAGALVVILIPGPVVMIEGRANLLKPRGEGGGRNAEGALYALIVFDGRADTFQMNVDINYTLEDVITVGGGLEAFFDFKDSSNWYIYIGRKDPETKRIKAEVISIVTADAYFMIDPNVIIFGAGVGIDLKYEYNPLVIRLILRLAFEIGVFLKEPQLKGFVELYGEISILIFGIGIRLILQTLLEGSAPQPWWIHGLARVAVSLPFPLPELEAQVEFEWGEDEEPARVDLLKGASMIHPKQLGKSWMLSENQSAPTIVPVDALAILSCGKPISNVSKKTDRSFFDWESVEGWDFTYDIVEVVLVEDNTGLLIASKSGTDDHTAWLNPLGGFQTDTGGSEEMQEAAPILKPHIRLWGYEPLGALAPEAASHYRDPCDTVQDTMETVCVHWRNVAAGTTYDSVFTHQGISFATLLGEVVSEVEGTDRIERGLRVGELIVRFPEPVVIMSVDQSGASRIAAQYRVSHRQACVDFPKTRDIMRLMNL